MIKNLLVHFLLLFFCYNTQAVIDHTKWNEDFNEDGIRVYKKTNHQGPVIPLMVKAELHHPLEIIMSALGDSENRKNWVPRQSASKLLKKNNEFDRIEYSVTEVPWPFNDREFVYRARTVIDAKNKTITIHMHSVPWAPFKNGHVRGHMEDGSMIIKQITPNVFEFTMMFESDPKGMIPNWLINIAQKKWPVAFIKNMKNELAKIEKQQNYLFKGVDFFNLKM